MSYFIHQGFRSVVSDTVRSLSVCLLAGVLVSAIRAQEPPTEENTFDPDDVVTVVFEIGDPSGSHSERWAMNVTGGPVALRPQSPEYGVVNTLTINQFRKGKSYRAMVDHLGTDPSLNMDEPDYDYQATVTSQSVGYYIKDPSQLLGEDGSSTFNNAAGKTATFGFPKPQIDFKDKDGNVIKKPAKADPGVFIRVNDDDSNADGEIDRLHPYGAVDPQMREVTLRMKLEGDTLDMGTVTLEVEGAGTVRLWDPADWTTPITLPKSWNLAVPAERAALPLDKTLYVEALTPGAQARDTLLRFKYTGTAAGSGSTDDEVNMSLFSAALAVDYDRDGTITLNTATTLSPDATTEERPFRFWSNDDDDNPDVAGRDYTTDRVDGAEDLKDFFPVFLDIKQLLNVLPHTSGAVYKLKHEDAALNFVYTSLTRATAFQYRTDGDSSEGYGVGGSFPATYAPTIQITADGVELGSYFLDRVKDQDQGVILVEMRNNSHLATFPQTSGRVTKPLRLVVEKGGVIIAEIELHLKSLEVAIRKKGEAVPENGVLVKKNDTMEVAIDEDYFNKPNEQQNRISWQLRLKKADGTYEVWINFPEACKGTYFEYKPPLAGIYQIRALINGTDEVMYKRTKTERVNQFVTYGPGFKSAPDSIGVCDTQVQIDACRKAQLFYGSTTYAAEYVLPAQYGFPEYGNTGNSIIRCNIFVAHQATAVGAQVPKINGYLDEYPPLANEWAGIQSTDLWEEDLTYIPGWPLLPEGARPQPGWIIAHPQPGDAGHCAIIDYDGEGIGAGTSGTVNKNYFKFWDGTSRYRRYGQ